MTKREQYGLSFSKIQRSSDGSTVNICKKNGTVNQYSTLQVIQQLNKVEAMALIEEINNALNGVYYEEYFVSDGTESDSIQLSTPNVILGENDFIIPMSDLKLLLQEWLAFINT